MGHALLDLIIAQRGYERTEDAANVDAIIADYLTAIQNASWDPETGAYDAGQLISDEALIEYDANTRYQIRQIAQRYYYNTVAREVGRSPYEDFADTFSLTGRLESEEFLGEDELQAQTRQEIEASTRVSYFKENFCCWVYELLGLNLDEIGCGGE